MDDEEIDKLFEEAFGEGHDEVTDDAPAAAKERALPVERRAALEAMKAKLDDEYASRKDEVRENWRYRTRKRERAEYANEQRKLGREVKPRRRFCASTPEAVKKLEELKRRERRDAQRRRRGVTDETVGRYTDCSAMSPEERKEHDRALAAERERLSRQRRKEAAERDAIATHPLLGRF